MTPDDQFWLTWGVGVVAAVATLLAVVVALFGDYLKAKLFAPALSLELASPFGAKTPVDVAYSGGVVRDLPGRYYHVRLKNTRAWPPATQAQTTSWQRHGPARWTSARPR